MTYKKSYHGRTISDSVGVIVDVCLGRDFEENKTKEALLRYWGS